MFSSIHGHTTSAPESSDSQANLDAGALQLQLDAANPETVRLEGAEKAGMIKQVFQRHDTNGDGTISKEELRKVILTLNGEFSVADLDTVFKQMDTNRDNKIQYKEFVDWLFDDTAGFFDLGSTSLSSKIHAALRASINGASLGAAMDELGIDIELDGEEPDLNDVLAGLSCLSAKQLREVFQGADVDKSGHLQLCELQGLLFPQATSSGEGAVVVAKVFAQMDRNRNGKVMCGEFVAFMLERIKRLSKVVPDADNRQIAAAFGNADHDSDGKVSLEDLERLLKCETEEERQVARRCFAALDADADGRLSALEFGRLYGKELVKQSKGIEVEWADVGSEAESGENAS